MKERESLIEKIKAQGLPGLEGPLPIVSLEAFFNGNQDLGSIGCNLYEHPGITRFFLVLKSIRDRSNVQDVLVEIKEVIEEESEAWPYSDRVYIITSASLTDVEAWVASLQPDAVEIGWANGVPSAAPALRESMMIYGVWWD